MRPMVRRPERFTERQSRLVVKILMALMDDPDTRVKIRACMMIVRMDGRELRREIVDAKERRQAGALSKLPWTIGRSAS